MTESDPYLSAFRGSFVSMLRWPQLDELWHNLRRDGSKKWYAYAIGELPPSATLSDDELVRFITEIDALLRREHDEDYCGIVYVDDRDDPRFIKIYDPNNLGSVCGSSGAPPPLPGWTLSTLPPTDLRAAFPLPGNRRRWWRRLFATD